MPEVAGDHVSGQRQFLSQESLGFSANEKSPAASERLGMIVTAVRFGKRAASDDLLVASAVADAVSRAGEEQIEPAASEQLICGAVIENGRIVEDNTA